MSRMTPLFSLSLRLGLLAMTVAGWPAAAESPLLVKDINPGSGSSDPISLTNVNGTLFFAADDGIDGIELWKSDGTAAGTVLVKDIGPGGRSSFPGNLRSVDGTLFFSAGDGTNGFELWKSDGTAAGTALVKDINPGGSSFPGALTNVNGTLFFSAGDGTNGIELWKSDGTAAGTVLVKDINPGAGGSQPLDLTNVDDVGVALLALGRAAGQSSGSSLASVLAIGLNAAGRALRGNTSVDRATLVPRKRQRLGCPRDGAGGDRPPHPPGLALRGPVAHGSVASSEPRLTRRGGWGGSLRDPPDSARPRGRSPRIVPIAPPPAFGRPGGPRARPYECGKVALCFNRAAPRRTSCNPPSRRSCCSRARRGRPAARRRRRGSRCGG